MGSIKAGGLHMKWIRDMSLKYKLPFLYTTSLIILCVASYLIISSTLEKRMEGFIEEELNVNTNQIYSMIKVAADTSVRGELRSIVRSNYDFVKYTYEQYLNGEKTEAQAKEDAWAYLSSQKIGSSGYIYILDSSGVIQYHPSEELIREDISQNEFVQLQMSLKEQYIQYDWKNPGESQARAKALYMKHFKPWDWVISASSYREEFTELIQVRDFEDELNKLTFGETGYSFIMQGDGTSLVHPYSKGKRLQDVGYGNGEALYQDIIKTKNGIFTYLWRNSADEKEREKNCCGQVFS